MKQLRKLFSLYVVLIVLVIAVAAGVNCGNGTSPQVAEEMVQDEETITPNPIDPAIPVPMNPALPVLQSDIEITRLEVTDYGRRLFKGYPFSILVQVTNQGQAASDDYTLAVFEQIDMRTLDDASCGSGIKGMMGSYTMGSLAPGETHTVKIEEILFDCAAWYTLYAEITPIGWQESNSSNHAVSLDIEFL